MLDASLQSMAKRRQYSARREEPRKGRKKNMGRVGGNGEVLYSSEFGSCLSVVNLLGVKGCFFMGVFSLPTFFLLILFVL